jgi:hypothetical protein
VSPEASRSFFAVLSAAGFEPFSFSLANAERVRAEMHSIDSVIRFICLVLDRLAGTVLNGTGSADDPLCA